MFCTADLLSKREPLPSVIHTSLTCWITLDSHRRHRSSLPCRLLGICVLCFWKASGVDSIPEALCAFDGSLVVLPWTDNKGRRVWEWCSENEQWNLCCGLFCVVYMIQQLCSFCRHILNTIVGQNEIIQTFWRPHNGFIRTVALMVMYI